VGVCADEARTNTHNTLLNYVTPIKINLYKTVTIIPQLAYLANSSLRFHGITL
jgi:hypothetical protein